MNSGQINDVGDHLLSLAKGEIKTMAYSMISSFTDINLDSIGVEKCTISFMRNNSSELLRTGPITILELLR